MGRLLQRSGNATSLPYAFLPGNHEVPLYCQSLILSCVAFNASFSHGYQPSLTISNIYDCQEWA